MGAVGGESQVDPVVAVEVVGHHGLWSHSGGLYSTLERAIAVARQHRPLAAQQVEPTVAVEIIRNQSKGDLASTIELFCGLKRAVSVRKHYRNDLESLVA